MPPALASRCKRNTMLSDRVFNRSSQAMQWLGRTICSGLCRRNYGNYRHQGFAGKHRARSPGDAGNLGWFAVSIGSRRRQARCLARPSSRQLRPEGGAETAAAEINIARRSEAVQFALDGLFVFTARRAAVDAACVAPVRTGSKNLLGGPQRSACSVDRRDEPQKKKQHEFNGLRFFCAQQVGWHGFC